MRTVGHPHIYPFERKTPALAGMGIEASPCFGWGLGLDTLQRT